MDHGLHAQRGHGHLCVYSAPRVGTVCVRCATEAISATRGGASGAVADPAAHGSSQGFGHPSPPSNERRAPTPPPRQRLNTTRARHARALAGILRDPASGPDVARR